MTKGFAIAPIDRIDADLRALAGAAQVEGFGFMTRMIERWEDGSNRFAAQGEVFLAVRQGGRLVAVGGLNRDPYCDASEVGRVRHLYVMPEARRGGAGTVLMAAIISAARREFSVLRLRTTTDRGAAFYEALGFERSNAPNVSHLMRL